MVPRLRTCRSPMLSARSANAGILAHTSALPATSAWGVMAPMVTVSPSTVIPLSSAMLPRSTTSDGLARRSFRIGSSVWPPARKVPSPAPLIATAASSSDDGR